MKCKNCQLKHPRRSRLEYCLSCGHKLERKGRRFLGNAFRALHRLERKLPGFESRKKRSATYSLLLLLALFGAVVYQNASANSLLQQARHKISQTQFEAAAADLNNADKFLVLGSLKKQIINTKSQNTVWLHYGWVLEQASQLAEQKKYGDAARLLSQISSDFPGYYRVIALQKLISQQASASSRPQAATATRKPVLKKPDRAVLTGHFISPRLFRAPPPVKSECYKIAGTASRSTTDLPDNNNDYQFHVIYVLPSDGIDRKYDTNGRIATSVSAWQNWLCTKTGGKTLKLDTFQGKLDISFVRLEATDKTLKSGKELPWAVDPVSNPYIYNDIENRLINLGFNQPNKAYLVYYDGSSNYACGGAGAGGMLYLLGDMCELGGMLTTNFLAPGYWEFTMLHEAIHALGFVPACAPNYSDNRHTSISSKDLMYGGAEPWQPSQLDVARKDYYNHGDAECPDLAKSAFLTGGGIQLPPAW